jgi:histidyl-tRNA synthetase
LPRLKAARPQKIFMRMPRFLETPIAGGGVIAYTYARQRYAVNAMSLNFRPVRGASDLFGEEERRFERTVSCAKEAARLYCFETLHTPIFEYAEVFCRTLGETSDAVAKEMYRFADKGGDELALRPEFTAGVARAFVTGGMAHLKPLKLFSYGPLFRYERPQKGRRRQFHQVNYEWFGMASPAADAEMIALGAFLLERLGIADRTVLEINSLGDAESRNAYRERLVAYLSRYEEELSEDSKRRLSVNPLRILDSKNPRDKEICEGAPSLADAYNKESAAFFDAVLSHLTDAKLAFRVNPRLVRGLDYYCHTAFEFTTDALGAQNTVLAGGRYDRLIADMGGEPTPAVGFAAGVERLCELIAPPDETPGPAFCVPVGEEAVPYMAGILRELRAAGIPSDWAPEGNVRKQFKTADKKRARVVLTAGSDETAKGTVRVKDMLSGEEEEIGRADVARRLTERTGKKTSCRSKTV